MKIYSKYDSEKLLDKTWYKSSNILYSECDDIVDSLKEVRITFNNGRTYQYHEVNVTDYLMFRDAVSQGKAFRQHISKYSYEKIDNVNIDDLNSELENEMNKNKDDFSVQIHENSITIFNNDVEIKKIGFPNDETKSVVSELIEILKIKTK